MSEGDTIIDDDEQIIEQRVKVIIVGDPGAGKKEVAAGTDVCIPFKSLGVSIGKKINLDKKINYKLTLIFWTLTKGRPKITTYFNGASAAIIVGDLSHKQAVSKMRFWAESIQENIGKIPLFFIGTKKRTKSVRSIEKLAELANDYNSYYYILSRAHEERLKPIYKSIARRLAKNYCKLRLTNNQ